MRYLPALAMAMALAAPAQAQTSEVFSAPELTAFDYGIVCYLDDANRGGFLTEAQIAETEVDKLRPVALRTLEVPAIPAIRFGVISAFAPGTAHEVLSTITLVSNAGPSFEDIATFTITDIPADDSWQIDFLTEFTLGTYRFHGLRHDVVIYDVTFTLVAPEEYTGALPDCVPAP